jgi:hypothetical protein
VEGPAGYRSAVLAVDTGAAQTLLHPDVIRAIGATDEVDRIPLNTVSDVIQAPRMRVERLYALGTMRNQFLVAVGKLLRGLRIDGLLGLDFLQDTKLAIDFRRGEIELEA